MGALNVALIPAAAPQLIKIRSLSLPKRRTWATAEPRKEPMCIIGPSRPTEPPAPIVTAAADTRAVAVRQEILPPLMTTASMSSGTP